MQSSSQPTPASREFTPKEYEEFKRFIKECPEELRFLSADYLSPYEIIYTLDIQQQEKYIQRKSTPDGSLREALRDASLLRLEYNYLSTKENLKEESNNIIDDLNKRNDRIVAVVASAVIFLAICAITIAMPYIWVACLMVPCIVTFIGGLLLGPSRTRNSKSIIDAHNNFLKAKNTLEISGISHVTIKTHHQNYKNFVLKHAKKIRESKLLHSTSTEFSRGALLLAKERKLTLEVIKTIDFFIRSGCDTELQTLFSLSQYAKDVETILTSEIIQNRENIAALTELKDWLLKSYIFDLQQKRINGRGRMEAITRNIDEALRHAASTQAAAKIEQPPEQRSVEQDPRPSDLGFFAPAALPAATAAPTSSLSLTAR